MKVISFSLWGTDSRFHHGAIENAKLAHFHYPDWRPFFFLGSDVPISVAAKLEELGAQVYWKTQTKGEWEGLFWRFEPIFDPFITHTISRDCDSRLNAREAAAVDEWLRCGQLFHSMRDHFEHNLPIMGGMFGCQYWPQFKDILESWTRYDAKGVDQDFLNQKVWPRMQASTLAHDRYHDGLTMPNRGGVGVYEYKPLQQLGHHDLRPFPSHAPVDPAIYGEHVGARVGV